MPKLKIGPGSVKSKPPTKQKANKTSMSLKSKPPPIEWSKAGVTLFGLERKYNGLTESKTSAVERSKAGVMLLQPHNSSERPTAEALSHGTRK
jgi:hypothetical protein